MADRCCYRGGYYRGGYGYGWVAPAIVGGVIGYELSRPNTVYVEPQPSVVYLQPQPTVQAPPPAGYHYAQMIDPKTNQYTVVLVPN
jgi:hypothetical protein